MAYSRFVPETEMVMALGFEFDVLFFSVGILPQPALCMPLLPAPPPELLPATDDEPPPGTPAPPSCLPPPASMPPAFGAPPRPPESAPPVDLPPRPALPPDPTIE